MEKKYRYLDEAEDVKALFVKDECDRYDYLAAVACGAIGGLIDIFYVGDPTDSKLMSWTDKKVDQAVMKFAKMNGWKPRAGSENNVKSAIGSLEKKFGINYDQRRPSDVGNAVRLSTKTHHMMSLGHSPDVIGLFFSVLNQFTNTSTFISNGQLVTVNAATQQLEGGNMIAKLFCGVANWFGHLMSDIAGSSGAVGRGTGIVAPFYELFGFCKFGSFDVNGSKIDLANLAQKAFVSGYDFRFALTQAIPVVLTELLVRLVWSLRRRFQYMCPWKECLPTRKHADLRMMLIIGDGTLCLMDVGDAYVRSGFGADPLKFFLRMNMVAWFRLTMLVVKEVMIRNGLGQGLQEKVEAYKELNEALEMYLQELRKIDIEAYRVETARYNETIKLFKTAQSDEEVHAALLQIYAELSIEKPYEGSLDSFMNDKSKVLVFK